MKILSICQDDFANFMYDNMKALRSVGLECDSVKLQKHPFYEEQSPVMELMDIWNMMDGYDVIQFFHDNVTLFDLINKESLNQRFIVYHTSSYYRANSDLVNRVMANGNGDIIHIACMPEFMAMCLGAVYMVGAVDTSLGIEATCNNFAHYPSNSIVKGTAEIERIFYDLDIPLDCSTEILPHKEQLQRISNCRVYVEMFTSKDGLGSAYGNFGITALEAAAMGKPVITNCRDWEVYFAAYGKLPFVICNDEAEFRKQVLLFWTGALPRSEEVKGRVIANHSYKATGNYFLKHVLKC